MIQASYFAQRRFRKNQSQTIKSAAPETQAKCQPVTRPATLTVPEQAANGQKRNQDSRTPSTPNTEQNPSTKNKKLDVITNFLADQSLMSIQSLGKDELVIKLKTCISYLTDLQAAANRQQT